MERSIKITQRDEMLKERNRLKIATFAYRHSVKTREPTPAEAAALARLKELEAQLSAMTATLKPGYAYRVRGGESEVGIVNVDHIAHAALIGHAYIDGTDCDVFECHLPDGRVVKYAQSVVVTRKP